MRMDRSVTLSNEGGKANLNPKQIKCLAEIGLLIHSGGRPFVFDCGRVGTTETNVEVIENGKRQRAYRSAARSRQGQSAWQGARAGASAAGRSFRTDALEASHGTELRALAQAYSGKIFESGNGFWVAIRIKPLGSDGSQCHAVLAVSGDRTVWPRAWAFETIGTQARPFALKHTNFPDASICAFDPKSGVWNPDDGLLALVDHYAIWMIKSWHRAVFGWWPGPQVGTEPYYRAKEFDAREFCGCGSGLLYGMCHRAEDLGLPEEWSRRKFKAAFGGHEYAERRVPEVMIEAARSSWRKLPPVANALGLSFPELHFFQHAA